MTIKVLREKPLHDYDLETNIQREMLADELVKAVKLYREFMANLPTEFYKTPLSVLNDMFWHNNMCSDIYYEEHELIDVTYGDEFENGVAIRITVYEDAMSPSGMIKVSPDIDIYVHGLDYGYECIDLRDKVEYID